MALVRTIRSAYATAVTARVTADVRDKSGRVIIAAGTPAQVPLGSPDETGRFGDEPDSSVWITLADGRSLALKFSVQGTDGSSGLQGQITKPRRWARLFRGLAEAGTAVGKDFEATRGAALALEEAMPARGDGMNSQFKIAEIKSGTRFLIRIR